jgi:hypothetical protein
MAEAAQGKHEADDQWAGDLDLEDARLHLGDWRRRQVTVEPVVDGVASPGEVAGRQPWKRGEPQR